MNTAVASVVLHTVTALGLALLPAAAAHSQVYIYLGEDGERLVSDHPVNQPGYRLLGQRDTLRGAGRVLAGNPIDAGGPFAFRTMITAAAERHGVEVALVHAVIQVESAFDPNAVSKKGATGLMQLISAKAQRYNVRDRFDPRANINAGVQHLRYLLEMFEGDLTLTLAAYNAGENAVRRFEGVPPYPETRRYVRKVMAEHRRYRSIAATSGL